jgi:hypothetical protein
MKKSYSISSLGIALLAAAVLVGCNKNQSGSAPKVSAEKNSFQEVTSKLDAGGDLYAYLSTEKLLDGVSTKVSGWRNIADAMPNASSEDHAKIDKGFDVVTHLIKNSGIEDVSGVGVSSIALEKDFYHSKFILHHYQGKGTGFLWTMFGQKAHSLDTQNLLPANTVLAIFSDLDIAQLWSVIQKETSESGVPEAEQFLEKLPAGFQKATGLEWNKVLASLGGEYGFILTLDDTRKITLPLPAGDGPLEMPEPALMLVFKVKDDTVFNRIDEALAKTGQQVTRTDKPGLKMRTVLVPIPFVPLRPSVARSGDYLFIASTDALIQEALAVQAGQKPGLKASEEFRHLSKDIPLQGNAYTFASQRLGRTMQQLQQRAMGMMNNKLQGPQSAWLNSMLTNQSPAFCYSVSANTDEGWVVVGNGSQHPAKVFLAASAVPAGVAAAVILPAIAKAKAHAQAAIKP